MLDYQFFLGFSLNSVYEERLSQVSLPIRSLFIQNDSAEYLQRIDYEGVFYLGKPLGCRIDTGSLDLSCANVYSLLRRLVPHYSYGDHPLILLPIPLSI